MPNYKQYPTSFLRSALVYFANCLFIFVLVSCEKSPPTSEVPRSLAETLGTKFKKIQQQHFSQPNLQHLAIPTNLNASAIWGATGRDDLGNIYLGLSSHYKNNNTAYLYQYDPRLNKLTLQGDVISQLSKVGKSAEFTGNAKNASQNKLHSKILQANDGYIYFSSFDEKDENAKLGILPKNGSHLWRKKPNSSDWQHLFAAPEALIALNTDGNYIYALGYWGHVLYQFDTRTGATKKASVNSLTQHISRNFLIGVDGHVFVPKVTSNSNGGIASTLVEYNSSLHIINTHQMEHYLDLKQHSQHGIISYATMKNGDLYFVTGQGALYKLSIESDQKYHLEFQVFLDDLAQKGSYMASLFSLDGENFLVSMGRQASTPGYSWLIYEVTTKTLASYPIQNINQKTLLYGSITRDDYGNLYVVGTDMSDRKKHKPVALKLTYDE